MTFMLRPTMSYRAIELDVPAGWLGAIAASFAIVPLILAIPVGHMADRYGEHRVARAGSVLLILCALCFALLGHSVPGLVMGGLLLGAGHLGCVVGQQALVANTTERGRFDAAFGHYTFVASIGQAAGPVLISAAGRGGPIPDTQLIFWWACGLSVLLTLFALPLAASARGSVVDRGASSGLGELIRRPGLMRALLTSCIVLSAVDITLVYLPALGADRGLAAGTVGALLAARGIASMVSRLFLGRLASAVGRRRLLVTSTIAAATALLITPLPVPVWVLAVLLVVAGFGLGVGQPLTMSWLAEAAPPGQRGRAMSLRLMGNRTGQVIIPSAAGLVAAGLGAAGVLWATALGLGWAGVAARRLPSDQ
ncbi:MAG: MFS transporter [Streptosporangiales bacterium]|nr:MFS transporter [Streptosporangiales bacterium]